jgi:hypothetical protein
MLTSYPAEKTMSLDLTKLAVNAVVVYSYIYCENHNKTEIVCDEMENFHVTAGGTYCYHHVNRSVRDAAVCINLCSNEVSKEKRDSLVVSTSKASHC